MKRGRKQEAVTVVMDRKGKASERLYLWDLEAYWRDKKRRTVRFLRWLLRVCARSHWDELSRNRLGMKN